MKTILKGIVKIFYSLFSLLLVILAAAGLWFGVRGYQMYKNAVEETPFSEKIESIRSMEGVTKYEELPGIYVDAVVAVEGKWGLWNLRCFTGLFWKRPLGIVRL